MKVTDFVKSTTSCLFEYFRCGVLYYSVSNDNMECYVFPVPVEDLGNATVKFEEKSITLMRYIRKAIEDKTMVEYKE